MRFPLFFLLFAAVAGAQPAPLSCPPAPAGRPCEAFHYHVALFRPDPRGFVELSAVPSYATQAACERAREQAVAANEKVVATIRLRDQKYEADKFGPCHCDMTTLADDQRAQQWRTAEDIRLRVRERLLDHKVTADSEAMRALYFDVPLSPSLAIAKLVPPPVVQPAPPVTTADDLKASRTFDTTKPTIAALDLPLAEILPSTPVAEGTPNGPPASPPAVAEASSPPPVPEPIVEQTVAAEPEVATSTVEEQVEEPAEDPALSAEAAAERFISYETERIQNVLKASSAISDEDVKTKIFEACMQRIQLLSNLRLLIEGSGSRSALAAAARDAQSEADRLALVARLFGESVKPHWAPHDASEVIFDVEPAIAAAPERALRDSTGRFSAEQKKHALYLVLAQTQPSEDQRLWLSTLVEGFLR